MITAFLHTCGGKVYSAIEAIGGPNSRATTTVWFCATCKKNVPSTELVTPPPADKSARTLADGSPVTDDHRELLPSGQQKGYVVLSAEERAKGFVRPVRRTYRHSKCGALTTMGLALAETYARAPDFYSGTFCATCGSHFPVGESGEFVWEGTDEKVGT